MDDRHPMDVPHTCQFRGGDDAVAPVFRQVIDGRRGTVSAQGELTRPAADQLRGTVEALRRSGHRCILVDLHRLRSADEVGLHALHRLRAAVEADGSRLTLAGLPEPAATNGHVTTA